MKQSSSVKRELWEALRERVTMTLIKSSLVAIIGLVCICATASEFEPNNSEQSAQSIELSEDILGNLSSSEDKDFFKLVSNEPQSIDVVFAPNDGAFPSNVGYRIRVQDEFNNVIGSMDCDELVSCGSSGIVFTIFLEGASPFFVLVQSTSDERHPEGQYMLSVKESSRNEQPEKEPNETEEQAQSLMIGSPKIGHLSSAVDIDVFSFEFADRNVVEIDIFGGAELRQSNTGFKMELRSADGILVAARACDSALNCDSGAVTLVAGVQGNAAYLLSVKTSQEGITPRGEYKLVLRIADQDFDRVLDVDDNCPEDANFDQLDSDFDSYGDVCDPNPTVNSTYDVDGDGEVRAFTDAFFISGSPLGFPFEQNFTRLIGPKAERSSITEINAYINSLPSGTFDFDQDGSESVVGKLNAQPDLLQLILHQLGMSSLICNHVSDSGARSCDEVVAYLDGVAPTPKLRPGKSSLNNVDVTASSPQPFDDQFTVTFKVQGSEDLTGFAVKFFYNSEKISSLELESSWETPSFPRRFSQTFWSNEADAHDLDGNPDTDTYFAFSNFEVDDGGNIFSESISLTFKYPNDTAGFVYPYISDLTEPYSAASIEPISLKFLDSDEDGTIDVEDAFPFDPSETIDTDGDGTGDNSDGDDDGDGVSDEQDALPLNAAETLDADADGLGDNEDPDDDNDGAPDVVDFYPFDASRDKYCCQKALIVAGGGPYFGNALWPATKNMANFAYETLLFQGLDDDDIIYLSEEESDIVDGVPTNESVRQAVINLADSADEKVDDVLIYMVDHGGDGVFKLDEQTLLYAEDLKVWLDELHQSYDGKSTVIYDACESGSFVPLLAANDGSQRMVITSSAAKQPAVFALNGYTSFSYFFWSSFYVGFNISDSQILAKQAMSLIWGQDPKFDANGDGLANTKSDKVSIEDFSFGQRAAKASDNPTVGEIQLETELNGESEVAIKVAEIVGGTSVNKVLVFIDDPDSYIPLPDEPLIETNATELSQNEDGSWSGVLVGFTIAGNYEVSVVAENKGGLFSIPDESDTVTVTQLKGRLPVIELDTDLDGLGDLADADDDNDGVEDSSDDFPLDASESVDTDGDGIGNNADLDDDDDNFTDEQELVDGTDPLNRFSCRTGCFSFDVDENLEAQPLTDGLLVIRHLFGFSGDSLTSGAVSGGASRDSSDTIASYLTDADSQLDIDGDGESKPLTDGLLLIRYLFGFSGDSLISGAIGDGAERDTAEEVEAYIKERVPAE